VDRLFDEFDGGLDNQRGQAKLGHIAGSGNDLVGFSRTTGGRTTVYSQLSFL
jgi:hypothetical protein